MERGFRFSGLALLVAVSAIGGAQGQKREEFALTILHTNDIHGHLLPFPYTEEGRDKAERPSVGGAARRASLIRNLRKASKNPTVLVDAGDVFTRGPLTNAYMGEPDIEVMNAIGYDLATFGNNEFKAKDGSEAANATGAQSALLKLVRRAKFPWLCANVTETNGALLPGVQAFVVRKIGPVRVGFLGLTAPRSGNYSQTKGWSFAEPVTAAKAWIPKVRAECDILIGVTHIGDAYDKLLAAGTTGLDAIVGGDSHTFLYKPFSAKNPSGQVVPIAQAGEFGANVGKFDLYFVREKGKWKLDHFGAELLPVGPDQKEASDINALLRPYLAPLSQVIGKIEIPKNPDERMKATAALFAEAFKDTMDSQIGLQPIDNGLFDSLRSSAVTEYDLRYIWPFRNFVVSVELKGSDLQTLVKNPNYVWAGRPTHIEPEKLYEVALADFIADSVLKVPGLSVESTGVDVRDSVAARLKKPAIKKDARAA
jgi:5'-nucleotidase